LSLLGFFIDDPNRFIDFPVAIEGVSYPAVKESIPDIIDTEDD
jgi:hypothetical protein